MRTFYYMMEGFSSPLMTLARNKGHAVWKVRLKWGYTRRIEWVHGG